MKRTTKLVSVLLAVLLACSSFAILPTFAYEHSSKAPGSQYEFGDVNRDGVIDIVDATLVQKKAADKAVLDDEQKILGDVNGDGEVDILDATLIQKFVVDRIDKFPVEDIVPTEPTTEPTDEPTTEEPTEPAPEGAYYILGTMNNWSIDEDYMLTANEAAEGEYMFTGLNLTTSDQFKIGYSENGAEPKVWYPDGYNNNYGQNGEITAAGTYDVYFRPDGQGGEDWFYNCIYVTAAEEQPTDEPGTTAEPTEPAPEGAYYILGTMNNWSVDENYMLTANEAAEGEYMFTGLELKTTDQFKVVYSEGGAEPKVWYPDGMGNNYGENGEIKADGTYDVYFRPDGQGGEDWFYNCIYVTGEEQPTDEPGTTAEPTEPGTTAEPGAEGYYIVGTMTGWAINKDYALTANEAAEGEYMFTDLELTTDDQFKVVYSADGTALTTWYPDGMGNNYGENGEIKADGTYDVYFRPDGQGGEDWFYNCIYVAGEEQPTDEPGTTAEPTGEPADVVYSVAGSSADIFGATWDASYKGTEMTKGADGVYSITFKDVQPANEVQFKVVKDHSWDVSYPAENYLFNVVTACDVTITFDPATETVKATGAGVVIPGALDVYSVIAVGNGEETYLNGASWQPANTDNAMTEIADGIWEFSMEDIYAFDNYQIKFAVNSIDDQGNPTSNPWAHNFGSEVEQLYPTGEAIDAVYNGKNCIFEVEEDGSTVKLQLDLRNFDFTSKQGAKMTITVTAPEEPVTRPTTEPGTTAEPGADGYYIVGTMTGWAIDADYALTANEASEGEYMFKGLNLATTDQFKVVYSKDGADLTTWYPDGMGNNYGENGEITAAGTYDVYFRPDGQGGEDWFYNCIYVTGEEQPTVEPGTTAEPTEPGTTAEPGADGYYIVGTMTNWAVDDNYRLAPNDGVEYDEYMFSGLNLTTTDQFKVVYSKDGADLTTWYPDGMGNNYGENGEIKADGTYDVYFRPDGQGGEDWFYNCIYVAGEEQPTDEPGTTEEPTEPGTTAEPGADGYYIVGTMTNWAVDADYALTANEASEGEYMFSGLNLTTTDQFKVVYSKDGADLTTWYPDGMGNNYGENGEIKADGTYDVYFRPDGQGGEDWFYNCIYVAGEEQPTDEPGTTEPGTEEPTGEPADVVYSVAGSSADIFGATWDASYKGTEMTKGADGIYSITFEDVQPANEVQFKVVKDHGWDVSYPAENYLFNVVSACDVTITFDPATETVKATGAGVVIPGELDVYSVIAVGNGEDTYLNGANWEPANTDNAMTEIADGIWEFSMEDIYAFDNYNIKFAVNSVDEDGNPTSNPWAHNFGSAEEKLYPTGEAIDAVYNGKNCIFEVEEDGSTVKLQLDLRNFDFTSKQGAKMTITVTAPEEPVTRPTTEPGTTAEPGAEGYYIVGTMTGWAIDADYALTANEASEGEYMFKGLNLATTDQFKVVYSKDGADLTTWYPDGMGNNYGENGEITAAGTYDVYFRPDGQGGEDWFYNCIYVTGEEQPTDEPGTTAEPTEPGTTAEPGAEGYFIVGTMTNWAVDEDYRLAPNDGVEYDEYMFSGLNLTTTDQFKVVYSKDGADLTTWYPDGMGNNYGENGEIKADGTYDVYFRPDGQGGEDWFYNCIYVAGEEQPTDEPGTTEEPTEPGTTAEPGADGYYIVGTMTNWAVDADYALTANEASEGEYMFSGLNLTTTDQFKVVYSKDGADLTTWYPDGMGNNYGENGEIKADGTYDVYFRPDGQGGEDWFYNCIYVAGEEQPTDEPGTTEPGTEEPTGEPADVVYSVAGSSADIFGATWDASYKGTEMTKGADGIYSITFEDVQPANEVQFKVVKDHGWDVSYPAENYLFNVVTACDVTITFDPATETVKATGAGVVIPGELDVYSVIAVGNGEETYLNGANWEPANTDNAMTEIADGIWEFSMEDIYAFDNYNIKFAVNSVDEDGNPTSNPWAHNFGSAEEKIYPTGEAIDAVYNGKNCIFEVEEDGSTVKLQLDLRNFDFTTKQGAKMTITVTAPEEPVTKPTAEPTEPGTTAEPGAEGYYIVGTMTGWAIDADYALTANEASEGEYMFKGLNLATTDQFKVVYSKDGADLTTWYPDGMGNNYGENGEITAAGTYDVYFRPDGQGGEDWFYNCIYVTGEEQPTVEPGTTAEPTEPDTNEPTEPSNGGYFIVGTMTNWAVDDNYRLAPNDGVEYDEYMFSGLNLTTTDQFKVVYSADGTALTTWYPDGMGNNYGENGEIKADGTYDVYFRPDGQGGEDWFYNCIYVAAKEQPTEPATNEPTEPATNEPTEPATNEPTEPAETITVYFTDAQNFGDVHVYYWPNGGEWPGVAAVEKETNDFGQKVYQATVPADVNGIIFNGNGRQTVDIKEGIEDGAWWYTVEETDDAGHNKVELVTDEPSTDEPTQPATDEPGTEEPTGEPADAIYSVAGSSADIFGATWDASYKGTEMTKGADGIYSITFEDVQPANEVQFKVVKDHGWDVSYPAENYLFNVVSACDVTITFDPATETVKATGAGVVIPGELDVYSVIAVGNGEDTYLNGSNWEPANTDNAMTEIADGIWEFSMEDIYAFDNYNIKFAVNSVDEDGNPTSNPWAHNFGSAEEKIYPTGEAIDAVYNGKNCIFEVEEDGSTVKLQLDLRNFDFTSKQGAKMTITVTAPEEPVTKPTAEPTEPATNEPTEPATNEPTEPSNGGYFIVGTMTNWAVDEDYRLAPNDGVEYDEYMFSGLNLTTTDQFKVVYSADGTALTTWYPDGMGNNYGENGEITAAGTYDVYFRPDGQGGEDWFYNCIYVAAKEQPTEPATNEPTEPATNEPTEPSNGGYFIVGTMTNWAVDEDYRLAPNDGVEYDEYMFSGLNLTTTDQFKVVYSADGTALTTWYPDGMGNNYGENGEITAAGTYDVYFRPDGQGGEDWFYNCIYVAAKEQPTEPATGEPTEPATNEPTEPATNEPTEPAETITVYFTDAQNFGDVHVYYWPNGGDWPGVAAVEKETNDFGQKVYQATVPADVNGIIFNGNGKQTVDITRGIEDGAWWYTLDTLEDGKYNVELVNAPTDPTDPTEPSTEEPATEPTTEEPAAEDVYSVAGSSANIFGSAWDAESKTTEMTKGADGVYSITFEDVQPESNVEYKVVKNHNWDTAYPAQNATFSVTAVSDVTITFDPATSAVNATVTPTGEPEPEPQGTVVKLQPNSNWTQDNARFAVYVFNNSTGKSEWADMTAVGDGTYTVTLPEGTWEKVIFCRMNPSAAANNWDNKWNQSNDLDIVAGKTYVVPTDAWDKWTA